MWRRLMWCLLATVACLQPGRLSAQEVWVADTVLSVPPDWVEATVWEQSIVLQQLAEQELSSQDPDLPFELTAIFSTRPGMIKELEPSIVLMTFFLLDDQPVEFRREEADEWMADMCRDLASEVEKTTPLHLEPPGYAGVCRSPEAVTASLFIPRPGALVLAVMTFPWASQERHDLAKREFAQFLAPLWHPKGGEDAVVSLDRALGQVTEAASHALVEPHSHVYENERYGLRLTLPVGFEEIPGWQNRKIGRAMAEEAGFGDHRFLAAFVAAGAPHQVNIAVYDPADPRSLSSTRVMRALAVDSTITDAVAGGEASVSLGRSNALGAEPTLYWDEDRQVFWQTWRGSDGNGAWVGLPLAYGPVLVFWIIDPPETPSAESLSRAIALIDGVELDSPGSESGVVAGPDDAPVTVVEFFDFRCASCREFDFRSGSVLRKRYAEGDGQVRWIRYEFPLSESSWTPAVAARCAGRQGRYWDMQDVLNSRSNEWIDEDDEDDLVKLFTRWAAQMEMTSVAFAICLRNQTPLPDVQAARAYGVSSGVDRVPYILINGHPLSEHTYEGLEAAIEAALAGEGDR